MRGFTIILLILLGGISFSTKAYAANTSIYLSPSSGNFSKSFKTSLIIDGKGDKFNAAQATFIISPNISIKDLTFGDCNFSFLVTPTLINPSFQGVILSSSLKKCTVYTLTIDPNETGNGTIAIKNASVKQYGDATEVLKDKHDAKYNFTGASSEKMNKNSSANNTDRYSVELRIIKSNEYIANAKVVLHAVDRKNTIESITNDQGKVNFNNIPSGIYDTTIEKDNKKIGETIINISGANHFFNLTINLDSQKNNPLLKNSVSIINTVTDSPILLGALFAVGLVIGIGIATLINRTRRKKLS